MNNYEISRDRAQTYFLGFDQEKMIRFWTLDADEQQLFVDFLGKRYCIDRMLNGHGTTCRGDATFPFPLTLK